MLFIGFIYALLFIVLRNNIYSALCNTIYSMHIYSKDVIFGQMKTSTIQLLSCIYPFI